jgi:D-apiose dehydrogenase
VVKKVKIGLIGCGYISYTHLEAYKEIKNAEVVAVCDINKDKLTQCQQKYHIRQGFTSIEELLENADVDAIDICTPVFSHRELVERAAQARKHVLCQKPFAINLQDAEFMCEICDKMNVTLMVKDNFRWFPWHSYIHEKIIEGKIGSPYRFNFEWFLWGSFNPEWKVWQEQPYFRTMKRAIWFDVGTHLVDVTRFLLGEPQALAAAMVRASDLLVGEDTMHTVLYYDNLFATLSVSWSVRGCPDRKKCGKVYLDGTKGSVRLSTDGSIVYIDNYGGYENKKWVFQDKARMESHIKSQEHFIKSIIKKEIPDTSGWDYLKTLKIVLSAYQSAESHEVVKL